MNAREATRLLCNDPETLLRRASVRIFGGGDMLSGRHHFVVFRSNQRGIRGFTTGFMGDHGITKRRTVIHIKLRRLLPPEELAIATDDTTVYAQYIAMRQTNDGVGATHRVLPAVGGPDLMLTSQLSGCKFGIGSDAAGNRVVSHIQPDGTIANLVTRGQDLDTALNLGFHNVDRTFGRGTGYQAQAAIVGIRRNGAWQIFAQNRDTVPIDPINVELQITQVSQLL